MWGATVSTEACLCVLSWPLKAAHKHLQLSSQLRGIGWTLGTCCASSHNHQMVLSRTKFHLSMSHLLPPAMATHETCSRVKSWHDFHGPMGLALPSSTRDPLPLSLGLLPHQPAVPIRFHHRPFALAVISANDSWLQFHLSYKPPVIITKQQLDRCVRVSIKLPLFVGSIWLWGMCPDSASPAPELWRCRSCPLTPLRFHSHPLPPAPRVPPKPSLGFCNSLSWILTS